MEFGLCTFADMQPEYVSGEAMITNKRYKELMEEIRLADELGLDVFAIGEHHRPDYGVSSPSTVLAAAAMITKNIRLSSGVTVLSSDDPIRVFQQFATIDQLSDGRAEIMAGRGSFIESFPLFGYDLSKYDELFEEKLELLMKINEEVIINWKGTVTPTIPNRGVYPRPFQKKIPIWRAAGGSPSSAVAAAKAGLPLMLAIIGGLPEQFTPFINLYRQTALKSGIAEKDLQVGINSHCFIAETSKKAADDFYPSYEVMMNRIGRERGWPPLTRERFEASRSPRAALMVGSPQEVTDKLLYEYELFGYTRFLAQMSMGTVEHSKVMKSIELFGTKVVPEVKKAIGEKSRQ